MYALFALFLNNIGHLSVGIPKVACMSISWIIRGLDSLFLIPCCIKWKCDFFRGALQQRVLSIVVNHPLLWQIARCGVSLEVSGAQCAERRNMRGTSSPTDVSSLGQS